MTLVYASCKDYNREALWESIKIFSDTNNSPWMVAGDFNSIVSPEEKLGGNPHNMTKSFPFINCIMDSSLLDIDYTESPFTWCNGFMQVVEDAWQIPMEGNSMWKFHLKLKNVCKKLSYWSKHTIGNIFDKTKELENRLQELEENCLNENSDINRMEYNNVNAQLIMHIKKEESYWRQKAGLKWYTEGDNNTKFFHSVINSKRKKLMLTRVKDQDGTWKENINDIAAEAVHFFEQQFTQDTTCRDFSVIRRLPRIVTEDDNLALGAIPNIDEVRSTVFSISSSSSSVPDEFSGKFFQQCWDIISSDLSNMILEFVSGKPLPRSFTHARLVLIPKIEAPQQFSDFRPISLRNCTSKIISNLLNYRLSSIMNKVVSHNQTGFIRGSVIADNIMLTQELVHNINRPNHNGNVVLKLDMTKAFDRVAWDYLCKVMRQMGFSKRWIDMVVRL
ncbi:hypothetical protein RDI58_015153 [Solanum bulbocastanum]|uniref:Reverse transcriptase domain-containing protein n=1 Tax=Solanum bulbocastanum TaxID=147425 RepID=A0AAN8YEQ0_SOLBU